MPDNYGVINEQGFVLGDNLGYKPLTEEESKSIDKDKDDSGKK